MTEQVTCQCGKYGFQCGGWFTEAGEQRGQDNVFCFDCNTLCKYDGTATPMVAKVVSADVQCAVDVVRSWLPVRWLVGEFMGPSHPVRRAFCKVISAALQQAAAATGPQEETT